MASVNLCDRCSRLGLSQAMGGIVMTPQLNAEKPRTSSHHQAPEKTHAHEICPGCVAEFKEWWNAGKGAGAGLPAATVPYSEPEPDAVRAAIRDREEETMIRDTVTMPNRATSGDNPWHGTGL